MDDPELMTGQSSRYMVIWKYVIHGAHQRKFESDYGPNGVWNNFFSHSADHLGSQLMKLENQEHAYFLLDSWTTKQAYEDFKADRAQMYSKMSADREYYYKSESLIGSCNELQ